MSLSWIPLIAFHSAMNNSWFKLIMAIRSAARRPNWCGSTLPARKCGPSRLSYWDTSPPLLARNRGKLPASHRFPQPGESLNYSRGRSQWSITTRCQPMPLGCGSPGTIRGPRAWRCCSSRRRWPGWPGDVTSGSIFRTANCGRSSCSCWECRDSSPTGS